jgi:hypothetical protein
MRKKLAFWLVAVALVVAVGIILGEALLRVAGHGPWRYETKDVDEPIVHEPDPELGWRNKPGSYVVPAYDGSGGEIPITVLPGGTRTTGSAGVPGDRPSVIVVGGSFTQGWGVGDTETYAYKLQRRFSGIEVLNYGTGAYGTYQSLLLLEREVPKRPPAWVIYGFFLHHEVRNTAPAAWLETLNRFSRRRHVALPFATLDDDGVLRRHAPESWLELPLRGHSALSAFAEQHLMRRRTKGRARNRRQVTERLLLEMQALTREHDARLAVVVLAAPDEARRHYRAFLETNGIRALDCVVPFTTETVVPVDGHPNGRMHSLWTECITALLGNEIAAASPASR